MLHWKKTPLQLLKEFDFAGLFLFSAGLTLFLMGLNWGGVRIMALMTVLGSLVYNLVI
jgi:hypothetical protein